MTPNNQLAEPVAERAEMEVDALAQEIRRVDGNHSLGAGQLAEALMPFLARAVFRPAPPEVDGLVRRLRAKHDEWQELCDRWTKSAKADGLDIIVAINSIRSTIYDEAATTITNLSARVAALASPAAISGEGSGAVTAKMVEAAWNLLNRGGYRIDGSAVHAALTAALATAPEGSGGEK